MPYAPLIDQIGPSIIRQGYENAANIALKSGENVANTITGVGNTLGNVLMKRNETKLERDKLSGQWDSLYDQGMIPQDVYEKFHGASLGKQRGLVGEWDAKASMLREDQLSQWKSARQMNYLNQQGMNAAALAQMKQGAEEPKYHQVVQPDGSVIFVSPTAPAIPATDAQGQPVKARQASNPLADLLTGGNPAPATGGAAPAAAGGAPANAATGASPFVEGALYEQGGVKYRYQGGQFVPVQ